MTHSEYVEELQRRLDWCVDTERYEIAARLRDQIEYETTEGEELKNQYYMKLAKQYSPEFYEAVKHKYEKNEHN